MNNPFQMLGTIKNPQQFLQQISGNSQMMQNPMVKNTFNMLQKGDAKGLEELGRNLYKELGMEPEDALKQVKSMFGM